jgi:hypothetical protein
MKLGTQMMRGEERKEKDDVLELQIEMRRG